MWEITKKNTTSLICRNVWERKKQQPTDEQRAKDLAEKKEVSFLHGTYTTIYT